MSDIILDLSLLSEALLRKAISVFFKNPSHLLKVMKIITADGEQFGSVF